MESPFPPHETIISRQNNSTYKIEEAFIIFARKQAWLTFLNSESFPSINACFNDWFIHRYKRFGKLFCNQWMSFLVYRSKFGIAFFWIWLQNNYIIYILSRQENKLKIHLIFNSNIPIGLKFFTKLNVKITFCMRYQLSICSFNMLLFSLT